MLKLIFGIGTVGLRMLRFAAHPVGIIESKRLNSTPASTPGLGTPLTGTALTERATYQAHKELDSIPVLWVQCFSSSGTADVGM